MAENDRGGSSNTLVYGALLMGGAYMLASSAHRSYGLQRFGLTPGTTLMVLVGAFGTAAILMSQGTRGGRRSEEAATVLVELRSDDPLNTPAALADVKAMLRAASAKTRPDGQRLLLDWRGAGAVAAARDTVAEGTRLVAADEPLVLPKASRAAGRAVYGRFVRVERVVEGSDGHPKDGGWTPFSKWGACVPHQGLCGPGTQTRRRSCAMPRPANGGAPCSGDAEELRGCELPCEDDASQSNQ